MSLPSAPPRHEAKLFGNFQTAGSAFYSIADLSGHGIAEIGLSRAGVIKLSEDDKAFRVRLHHFIKHALELVSPSAAENDDLLDIPTVHPIHDILWLWMRTHDHACIVQMTMDVDHRELGAFNGMFDKAQLGLRAIVTEKQVIGDDRR